jgi:hypothetical protein
VSYFGSLQWDKPDSDEDVKKRKKDKKDKKGKDKK